MRVKGFKKFQESASPVPGWDLQDNCLYKSFEFEDFAQAWGFLNRVVEFATEADHHPKILNDYNKVDLWLTSHDKGTVTSRDISLAEEINKIRI